MKLLRPSLAILTAGVLSANAQTTVATDPVGYVSTTVNANSDQKIGVPISQAPAYQGQASGVAGVTVSASDIPTLSGANYLLVTSGSAEGQWEQIASSTTSSVDLDAAITGFTTGDSFSIIPFWTLGNLLPGGGGLPVSSDVFSPQGLLLANNPAATGINLPASKFYFYHDGSQGPAGWYDAGDLGAGLQDAVIVNPEVSLTLRNQTGSPCSVVVTGSVPVKSKAITIASSGGAQQDNLVYNQFPAGVTLGTSGLVADGAIQPSADVFAPGDLLLVYPASISGINPSASAFYFYHDGSQGPAGWYNAGDLGAGLQDNVEIPAAAAVIVRKAAGSASATWTPTVPYNLN